MLLSFLKDNKGITLGLATILLTIVAGLLPNVVELLYSRGLFLFFRKIMDVLGLLPVPLFYLFFGAVLLLFVYKIIKRERSITLRQRMKNIAFLSFNFIGYLIFAFQLLWGINYQRIPLTEQLELDLQPLGEERIKLKAHQLTAELQELRKKIPTVDTNAIVRLPNNMETVLQADLKTVLHDLGYPNTGNVKAKSLIPKGILLRWSTSGIYWPFVGQGNIDDGLHELQKPFTVAHEMAHGYGIGNEAACNFLAYLTCQKSEDPLINYIGKLTYWRYLAFEYRIRYPEEYPDFRKENVGRGMYNDLAAIYDNAALYQDILPAVRDGIYDNYLKLQGIEDGLENYNKIVLLVDAWERKHQ